MKLADGFRAPELRVDKTVMFCDIADSTGMKEKEAEAGWLTTFGYFYDLTTEVIASGSAGTIVKYLGDGAMVVYDEDHTTHAINDAIRIQEAIKGDIGKRQVNVH